VYFSDFSLAMFFFWNKQYFVRVISLAACLQFVTHWYDGLWCLIFAKIARALLCWDGRAMLHSSDSFEMEVGSFREKLWEERAFAAMNHNAKTRIFRLHSCRSHYNGSSLFNVAVGSESYTGFDEMMQYNSFSSHSAVHSPARSSLLVPIESPCATYY